MQSNTSKKPMETPVASARRVMLVLMSLTTLYEYMYCTMLSSALGMLPIFGGAMFMNGRVGVSFTHLVMRGERKYLTRRMQLVSVCLTALMMLCTLVLVALYPVLLNSSGVWIVFTVVLAITLRSTLGRRLVGRSMRRTVGKRAFWLMMLALHLVPLIAAAWVLLANTDSATAWQMLGGFVAGSVLECYSLWRERDLLALEDVPDDIDPQTVASMAAELRHVNAYNAFQRMYMLVLLALQITLVLVYTFIGLTTQELFTCMLLAMACTLVMREISMFCLKHVRRPFATQLLLIGLFLWGYGLLLFYRQLGQSPNLVLSYCALALSVSGLTVSVSSLAELERRMTDVAAFKLQDHMRGYSRMRSASTEMVMLLGQMLALCLLTLLCLPPRRLQTLDLHALAAAFRPLMIVPPLLLLVGAIVSVLHFPMNNRHFQKLARWLTLEKEGLDNPALRQQLDSVVVQRHKNRFGVRVIITLLRPLYYHKVYGKENLAGYEDGSIILVCNHGELYGPVVANLYVPIAFRPWVIANMMDRDAIIEHVYQGTMMRQKWIPESWKRPMIRAVSPLVMWLFGSLDAIPVHRGQPRELIKTFRLTLDAMQAGDNILLFPENGEDHELGQPGYAREGVGKLYTGFAMIAPLYYAKVHKRAVFVPIYASRKLRTLTIGKGVQYNPEANATTEKLRIVDSLLGEMQQMYEKECAVTGAKAPQADSRAEN
ncbi:MAG: hypothetical protein RR367_01460 [Clostridia bacterium]